MGIATKTHQLNDAFQFISKKKTFTGSVDLEELILAFKELGIDVDKAEATKLLER